MAGDTLVRFALIHLAICSPAIMVVRVVRAMGHAPSYERATILVHYEAKN